MTTNAEVVEFVKQDEAMLEARIESGEIPARPAYISKAAEWRAWFDEHVRCHAPGVTLLGQCWASRMPGTEFCSNHHGQHAAGQPIVRFRARTFAEQPMHKINVVVPEHMRETVEIAQDLMRRAANGDRAAEKLTTFGQTYGISNNDPRMQEIVQAAKKPRAMAPVDTRTTEEVQAAQPSTLRDVEQAIAERAKPIVRKPRAM